MSFEILYNDATVLLILACITLLAIWLSANVKGFKAIGAAATTILLGMVLSNAGALPADSAIYEFVSSDGVLVGIILVLLKINLSTLKEAGLPMIKAFIIGAFGSALGALVMGYWLFPQFGEDAWKLSGQFSATYIGGGMNYAAMGRELGTSSDVFSAGIAADVIITAIWLVVCITVPTLFSKTQDTTGENSTETIEESSSSEKKKKPALHKQLFKSAEPIGLYDIALMGVIVLGIMWISKFMASMLPIIPMIIWLTTLVLILAQIPRIKRIPGSMVVGNYFLLLFLTTNGAMSAISKIIEIGPSIFYFALGTVAIHGVIIFGIGRLMKIDFSVLTVASQANVGGSTSALAIAGARGYSSLILSGVAVGMLGNAAGNYIGLLIAALTKFFVQ